MVAMLDVLLDDYHCERFRSRMQVDVAYGRPRRRASASTSSISAASFRRRCALIPPRVRTVRELNLPPVIERSRSSAAGSILVTGTTGSGKSTTLAAMIDHINRTAERT